ncbi:Hypothetical_protein [Hexamita inflata]|uniref:Hypothetical_protein n=1 Tax=Hexamita inflata TaxID=28002 RepID=A0AA86Q0F2_9EUKA|nr:Hypothetical protein HINF_LOCUS37415 [Hexamita inflata]
MMLPDSQYNFLFSRLALKLNIRINTIHELFIQISSHYLKIKQQRVSLVQMYQRNKCNKPAQNIRQHYYQMNEHFALIQHPKQKIIAKQNQTPLSQFKKEFVIMLRKLLQIQGEMTNKQLCSQLKTFLSNNKQRLFWEYAQIEIPYKTSFQLKQYFQKSFLRCKFDGINNADKQRIKEITHAMRERKPAEIADAFIAKSQNMYFRREVLMLVQYFKRTNE